MPENGPREVGSVVEEGVRVELLMALIPGGSAVKRTGYTLTILRKQADGRWLLARDANLLT